MLKDRQSSESGFTVVEAVVAGLILVIGILGGVSVFDTSRRESGTGERLQVAQSKAASELERLRDIPYDELLTNSSESWATTGYEGDPTERIVDGSSPALKISDDETEELIRAAGAGIKPYSPPEQVDIGGSQFEVSVYRFVTWRDVECQVVDLAPVKASLSGDINAMLTRITSINSYSNTLLSGLIGSLLNLPLLSNFKSDLQLIKTNVTSVQTQLNALLTAVSNLNELDPCDADLTTLDEINDSLDTLAPALNTLDSALLSAKNAPKCTVVIVTVVCPTVPVNTTTVYNTARNQITAFRNANWQTQVQGLVTSLGELSSDDHTHNTKRVTVAVLVDPVTGSGPFEPVWASSIIADPDAELLDG
jgi:hypothetical protein